MIISRASARLTRPVGLSLRNAAPALRQQQRAASHGPSFNPPTGFMFGEKPGPRKKEDWENIYMYGMFGGMGLMLLLYLYKPDTTVQTWALSEAKKKLEAEGGMPKWEKTQ